MLEIAELLDTFDRRTSIAAVGRHDGVKQDRQLLYKRNIEARSRYKCCNWKTISITYSECVSVNLVNQHAKRVRRIIVICGLSASAIFFHIFS